MLVPYYAFYFLGIPYEKDLSLEQPSKPFIGILSVACDSPYTTG